MGIKNLTKFLRDKFGDVFEEIHISHFAYMRVAIDISLYMYKYKSICGDRWMSAFLNLVSCLRRNEIHCVFIYDGPAPPEKEAEQAKRREEKAKLTSIVEELEFAMDIYHQTGEIQKCLRELYDKRRDKPKSLLSNPKGLGIDMIWVENRVRERRSQIIDISPEDFENTKKLFDILQVPYYTAPIEAEKMCAGLCVMGFVDAVLSEDSDVLAYGAPLFLSKIDTKADTCTRIIYNEVLTQSTLTSESFLDFCIMCGTDYNPNIYKVGPHTAFKYLLEYKNIEGIRDAKLPKVDITVLKHNRVRELFTFQENYNEIIEPRGIPYCGRPNSDELVNFLSNLSLPVDIERIKSDFTREIVFESDNED